MDNLEIKKEEIIVKKEEGGVRLDKFLAQRFTDFSRSHIQKLIRKGKILVNGESKETSYKIIENDIVHVDMVPPEAIDMAPDKSLLDKIKIIFENDDIIVIDKPAGLTVHPGITKKSGTLVNALLAKWPNLVNVGEDPLRPGIVHRLDKETSGLMLIVKNNEAFNYFKKLFQDRGVEKRYVALVAGKVKNGEGVIDLPIARSKAMPTKQVAMEKDIDKFRIGARKAVTYFKVLKYYSDWTLIEAYPKTGRMHQIRVHFRALGHPIANDKKYSFRKQAFIKGLDRHFLHAAYLKFRLKTGEDMDFSSPLPEDLNRALESVSKE